MHKPGDVFTFPFFIAHLVNLRIQPGQVKFMNDME